MFTQYCALPNNSTRQKSAVSHPHTAQETSGCFCPKGSSLPHGPTWSPPGPPGQAAFHLVTLSLSCCLKGHDWAFPFVKLNVIPVIPFSQLADVPMNGSTTAMVYQLLLPALDHLRTCRRWPLLCSINKVINEGSKPSQPQSSPWVQDAFLHHYLKKTIKKDKSRF